MKRAHDIRAGLSIIGVASSLLLLWAIGAGCGSTVDAEVAGASTGSATGAGGGSSSGEGGQSGTGGAPSGCVPGALIECYSGPPGTENIGVCHGGAKKCADDGSDYGPCQWEVTPKTEDCKTPDDEDCNGVTEACPGQTVWSEAFSGAGNQYAQGVVVDPSGNIIIIGGFDSAFSIGGSSLVTKGMTDFFIAKFDPAGKPIWAKSYGSAGDDYAVDVATDAQGNIAVTGSVAGDVDFGDGTITGLGADDAFVLKLDPQGNMLWRTLFGSASSEAGYGVAFDAAGNLYTTGNFGGTVEFGTGPLTAKSIDMYLVAYSPTGVTLYAKQFGGMYDDYGSDVVALPGGEILVTGGFYGPVDFGTGPLITTGAYDAFVAKFDATGKASWATQLKGQPGMGNFPVTLEIAADPSGSAIVTGYMRGKVDFGGGVVSSAGGTDAFLAKYDGATGKHVFSERFGGSYVYPGQPNNVTDAGFGVTTDAAGNILLIGTYIDTIDLGGGPLGKQPYGDMYFARFDPFGKHIFSKNYGTAVSYASGEGVALGKSGDAILAGYFVGTIDFGKGQLSTATNEDTDIFIAEIAP